MENQNVKRFCQSCGMPLQNEADYGTEARGARSEEYCTYCYQNGGFTADCTMDEMIDFCIRFEQQQNPGLDAEDARRAMRAWYPTLKRWKQAQGRRVCGASLRHARGRALYGKTPRRQGRPNSTRRLLAPRVCAKISGLHPRTSCGSAYGASHSQMRFISAGVKTGISHLRAANLWSTRAAGRSLPHTAARRRKTALDKPFPLCYLKKQQLRCCFLRASRHFVPGRLRS